MFREFLTCLGAIGEPRQAGTIEHKLIDVPAITVCAVLAHAETLEDIVPYGKHGEKWPRGFPGLPNGIASHDTFRRVFMSIDADRLEDSFPAWTRAVFSSPRKTQTSYCD